MYVKVRLLDWNIVSYEEVGKSVGGTEDYLSNLKECQGLLYRPRDTDTESGESVVEVLGMISDFTLALLLRHLSLTMIVCKNELMKTNIQIGGDM